MELLEPFPNIFPDEAARRGQQPAIKKRIANGQGNAANKRTDRDADLTFKKHDVKHRGDGSTCAPYPWLVHVASDGVAS